jgi:hypothetical protein
VRRIKRRCNTSAAAKRFCSVFDASFSAEDSGRYRIRRL